MFYLLAIIVAVLAGVALFWPLLSQGGQARNYALSLVLVMPVAALLLYQQVGTPLGIGISGKPERQAAHPGGATGQMSDMVAQLELRLQENPADLEGWILLGRSYKTMQQFDAARSALLRAYQMAPDDPLVLAELAEAQLFASGRPTLDEETRALLERAVSLDPEQQKALWLLGIAANQDGDQTTAVQYWQKLISLTDPGSPVARSVQEQIDRTQARLGIEAPQTVMGGATAPAALEVRVAVDGNLPTLPGQAALFLIIRDPAAPAPPLGAKRIANPAFPVTLTVTDADSMLAERPIFGTDPLQIQARISLSGSPVAAEGDIESAPISVSLSHQGAVELTISVTEE